MQSATILVLLLLCQAYFVQSDIYSRENVPDGELPPPLQPNKVKYNVIQIGAGSGGGLSAALLAQSGCVKVLVLESAGKVDYSDPTIGIIPGLEFQAYFEPGLEKQFILRSNPVLNTFPRLLSNSIARKGRGGDQRISHFAIEWGDNRIHQELMSDPLGNPLEWSVDYVWDYISPRIFNWTGILAPNHPPNTGKIRVQPSRDSLWQESWLNACSAITGATIVDDFNVIDGSIQTCSAEPSNVRTDGTRSNSETEYLIPEASCNQNLDLVYDAQVTRILFDCDRHGHQVAVGVEGTYRNIPFSIEFHPSQSYWGGGQQCDQQKAKQYRQVVLSTGTYENVQLLEISGVGRASSIENLGIELVADIPAVGENLQDCTSAYVWYVSGNGTAESVGIYPSNTDLLTSRPAAFVNTSSRTGFLLWTPFPSFPGPVWNGLGLSFEMRQENPGSVHLLSPNHGELLNVTFPWNEFTLQKHVEALELIRRIVVDGGIADTFQLTEFRPGANITGDDLAFAITREQMEIVSHAAGTTRMTATGDPNDGVVDLDFNVLGVKSLKLGSMSVLRYVPAAGGQTWSWAIGWNLQNQIRSEVGAPLL